MKQIQIIMAAAMLTFLLSSCYTQHTALKRISKAHAIQPAATAKACAAFYPAKDSVSIIQKLIQGATDTLTNYITVDCDSARKKAPAPFRIKMPCPPSFTRVDTLIDHQYHSIENTALVEAQEAQIQSLNTELTKATTQRDALRKREQIALGILGILALAAIFRFYIKKTTLI